MYRNLVFGLVLFGSTNVSAQDTVFRNEVTGEYRGSFTSAYGLSGDVTTLAKDMTGHRFLFVKFEIEGPIKMEVWWMIDKKTMTATVASSFDNKDGVRRYELKTVDGKARVEFGPKGHGYLEQMNKEKGYLEWVFTDTGALKSLTAYGGTGGDAVEAWKIELEKATNKH